MGHFMHRILCSFSRTHLFSNTLLKTCLYYFNWSILFILTETARGGEKKDLNKHHIIIMWAAIYPCSAAALYSQQESYRLWSRCRPCLICPWTFVLCNVHLCCHRRTLQACVCSMFCCGSLSRNPHCQPEKQFYFRSFEHKQNNVFLPFFCFLLQITCPSRAPPRLSRGS